MLPLKHLDESGNAYVITISTKCKVYKAIDIKQIIVIYSQNGDTLETQFRKRSVFALMLLLLLLLLMV